MQLALFEKKETVEDARAKVHEAAKDKGCHCPVCDQFVKVYRHNISQAVAQSLVEMYRLHRQGWFHIDDVNKFNPKNGGSFAKLRHWGLVEERPNDDDRTKRTSGWWRITHTGEYFVKGDGEIFKYALLYNGKCLGHEGELRTIHDCYGDHFNFHELMMR